jgi:NAD(P)-dependent dehydrogenase (short-subunit alcohol dehydrogenase family)
MGEAMDFSGKVVLVTGSGRGIGEAAARLFAQKGAAVVLCSRSPSEIDAVAESIRQSRGKALAIVCDVADESQVKALFAQVKKELGPVDILVNNAALFFVKTLEQLTVEEWDRMMGVNVRSLYLCSKEAARQMKPKKKGVIVNISSVAGVPGYEKFPGSSCYCASKGAVTLFTEALAAELKPFGIKVNALSPGGVDTRMFREGLPQLQPDMTAEEVAQAILFLASDDSRPAIGVNWVLPG